LQYQRDITPHSIGIPVPQLTAWHTGQRDHKTKKGSPEGDPNIHPVGWRDFPDQVAFQKKGRLSGITSPRDL